ncbi:reverse transcriptase domain-containing protein, partial [Caldithrix abyssi]
MYDLTNFLGIPACLARVELDITEPIVFKHFYHGNVIRALIINLLKKEERYGDHGLAPGIVPVVLENGYLNYKPGDIYTFGLIFLGSDLHLSKTFKEQLAWYVGRPEGPLCMGLNARLKDYVLFDEVNLLNIFTRIKKHLNSHFTIRILTPLAIDRKKEDIVTGHTRYDQQLFRLDVFLTKIIDRFNNLCRSDVLFLDEIDKQELPPVALNLQSANLVWLELPTRLRKKNYGGVVGRLQVAGTLDDFWLMALIAGSIMHIGEKINFGFGFYDIPELFADIAQILKPKTSLVDQALDHSNLSEAFLETKRNSQIKGEMFDEFEDQYEFLASGIREKIKKGSYQPAPLKGLVSKNHHKIRALAVPTVLDRWLQRAVLNILAPTLDTLFEDCSYAYRRNYSRQQAQAAIRKAYDEGFRYVVEADIENFFDEVEWKVLLGKLRALFPFDPVVDLIEAWVKAPVLFRGNRIERKKGLPQGAVISPLLSNLYLDEFDEQIRQKGFCLIRFADDFVILCKTKKQAEEALRQARNALKQLDLELKESKTRITHFDEGFRYLGYLFCRSVVLETMKEKDKRPLDWSLLDESKIPPHSWLANARFNGQTLEQFLHTQRQQLFKGLFNKLGRPPVATRKTIYLGDFETKIKVKNNQLMVYKLKDEKYDLIDKVPLEIIQQIILLGPVPLSMPALFKLIRRKIPILFASAQSKPVGMVEP